MDFSFSEMNDFYYELDAEVYYERPITVSCSYMTLLNKHFLFDFSQSINTTRSQ